MNNKILVVDDSKFNRLLLKNILASDYEILEAENGQEGLDIIEANKSEMVAVLLDVVMPVLTGVEFLKIANERNYMDLFPVLMVTGEKDMGLVEECFDYGISDFIRKPVNTDFVKNRVDRLVDLYKEKNKFKAQADRQTQTLQNQYKMLQAQSNKLRESNENIIRVLGTIVEYRNLEVGNHIRRIGSFTEILATQLMEDYPEYELTPMKIHVIASASALHDVGKILVPDRILLKPGKLTEEEFEYMKSHSILGYGIIDQIASSWDDDYVQYSKEITRWHHEKYDGKGYPDGLVGDEIPIAAQIVSLADCYDALISDSVYHEAYPLEDAFHMIRNGECGLFSPKLLSVFTKTHAELERSAEQLRDVVDDVDDSDD
jgi:putative two-component system response regulator